MLDLKQKLENYRKSTNLIFFLVSVIVSDLILFVFDIHWNFYPGGKLFPPQRFVFNSIGIYLWGGIIGGIAGLFVIKLFLIGLKKQEFIWKNTSPKKTIKPVILLSVIIILMMSSLAIMRTTTGEAIKNPNQIEKQSKNILINKLKNSENPIEIEQSIYTIKPEQTKTTYLGIKNNGYELKSIIIKKATTYSILKTEDNCGTDNNNIRLNYKDVEIVPPGATIFIPINIIANGKTRTDSCLYELVIAYNNQDHVIKFFVNTE
jgi:hypothetical protein